MSPIVLRGQALQFWTLHSKVTDCNTGKPIPYADIYNESARTGVYADSSGSFRMRVRTGDTLTVQSLGYLGSVYIIHGKIISLYDTLDLCPQMHDLGEVTLQLPHSYEAFKRIFLEIEPERGYRIEGLPEPKIQDIPVLMDTNILNSAGFAINHPVSFFYYKYSKEEKSKRKVFYLQRQEREQLIIDKKYNRELIQEITGLMGDSITDFIVFCNFSRQFLYMASELEIIEEIDRKYKEFIEKRE